ncbi:hypothetical protein MMC22_004418 [Lobaria immixta]|nr:hypothetical protein [Lobaria immixta]
MSEVNEARIDELQKTVTALCARVVQLEGLMMAQNQPSTAQWGSNLPVRPAPSHEPLYTPPQSATEKPAASEKPAAEKPATTLKSGPAEQSAPTKKAAPPKKPAFTKQPFPHKATAAFTQNLAPPQSTRAPPKPQSSILFDANIPTPKPNQPEIEHFKFIQTLHRDGHSKEDITNRALETFPDLCKGQGSGTEEARKKIVLSKVEIYTSRWAESYI